MELKHRIQHLKSILGLGIQLAKANFKLRNEGSFLGIFWYLLEPLLLFIIILGIRSAFMGSSSVKDYPLYLMIGLVMINFFTGITSKATSLISGSGAFIKSMKINYESLVVSQVLEGMFSHFFEYLVLIGFVLYYHGSLIGIIIYPVIFGFFMLFILGFSFILSTIGVYVNDLGNLWRVITRFLFFATPIFYIAEKNSMIYNVNLFNPLFYFISIAREMIIVNSIPEIWMVGVAIGISFFTFVIGVFVFNRYKYKFAEMV